MKVLYNNAVMQLFEKAEVLSQEPHDSWRCVYVKLSSSHEKRNHALYSNFIVGAIKSLLIKIEGYIYLCDDGDIFILFQGALKPIIKKLSSHFGDLDEQNMEGYPRNNPFILFDLSKHWDDFYYLCETKYLRALVASEEARAQAAYLGRPMKSPSEMR